MTEDELYALAQNDVDNIPTLQAWSFTKLKSIVGDDSAESIKASMEERGLYLKFSDNNRRFTKAS